MVAMTTSTIGTTRRTAPLRSLGSRICGKTVTLATKRIDPPSTRPSSAIRLISVGRRRASGKRASPATPTSRQSSRMRSLTVAVRDPATEGGDQQDQIGAGRQQGRDDERTSRRAAAGPRWPVAIAETGRHRQTAGDQSQTADQAAWPDAGSGLSSSTANTATIRAAVTTNRRNRQAPASWGPDSPCMGRTYHRISRPRSCRGPGRMTRRILIVDDDELVREVAQSALTIVGGWEVVTARSGDEACQVAAGPATRRRTAGCDDARGGRADDGGGICGPTRRPETSPSSS